MIDLPDVQIRRILLYDEDGGEADHQIHYKGKDRDKEHDFHIVTDGIRLVIQCFNHTDAVVPFSPPPRESVL